MTLRALNRRMNSAFGIWKKNHKKAKIAYEINTEGDIAVEAERTKRRVNILKKFLIKNGHTRQEIDSQLEQKKQQQNSNMKAFVIKLYFKISEFNIVPKAFNQLKAWTKTKKMYREAFETMSKFKNSHTYWAFRRWKYSHENERQAINSLSKQELIQKCIKDEQLLGSLKCEQQNKTEHIELQIAERDQLLVHFASGQKIAFNRCEHKLKWKPLRKAFLKWQKYAFDAKVAESAAQLEKTQSIISELMKICNEAENKNKDLILDNEELRQASLDGIEIAKAVQELTKEREKLSKDLNKKNVAIQQLIDDNNVMSEKLSYI